MKKLILTFFAILTFFLLVSTYAIFESNKFYDADMKIAKWNIEINGVSVNENKKIDIDDIIWSSSSNVVSGKVAPGMEGYFDISINPKQTDVAVRFDLVYDMDYLKSINKSFEIIKVEEINDKKIFLTDKNTYTGIIKLDEIKNNTIYTVRTYIKWQDIEENNENDYLLGTTSVNFELPINISVTQYLDEEILEYNEE